MSDKSCGNCGNISCGNLTTINCIGWKPLSFPEPAKEVCVWVEAPKSDIGERVNYHLRPSCGRSYDSFIYTGYKFCPYCGKKIEAKSE